MNRFNIFYFILFFNLFINNALGQINLTLGLDNYLSLESMKSNNIQKDLKKSFQYSPHLTTGIILENTLGLNIGFGLWNRGGNGKDTLNEKFRSINKYLNLPLSILFRKEIKDKLFIDFEGGAMLSKLWNSNINPKSKTNYNFKSYYIGLLLKVGLNYEINKEINLKFDLFYNQQINDALNEEFLGKYHGIGLNIGVHFNFYKN